MAPDADATSARTARSQVRRRCPLCQHHRVRVLLDTNLWSSIGDEGVVGQFNDFVRSRGLEVIVSPSTLLEVIQLPAEQPRQRIINALAVGSRRRLPTEAQSESAEVVSEIRRTRPSWVRAMPDTARVASSNAFWTKQIWREARQNSQRLHDYQLTQSPIKSYLVRRQREQRGEMIRTNFTIGPLTAITATPLASAPEWYLAGWAGDSS
jgi:hypothetical protein